MCDTKNDYLYIGTRCYKKETFLFDIEVLDALQKEKCSTPAETINKILREALLRHEQ